MVKVAVQLWLYAIIILLIILRTEAFPVNITYVESAVAKGAVCLDGSPPAYHYAEGFDAGVNNWIIQIEGGGWCQDVRTCLSRKDTKRGSSKEMETQVGFSGILSNRPRNNPGFYNWNKVKVRYCDGSSFTGDVEAVDPATNLHYRGARAFLAIMDDLLEKGMKNAENAILSGCSAGGLASILHCDKFKTLLPVDAKVKCFADAGFFINANDISGVARIEKFYSDVVSLHDSAKNLPPSCTSRMKPNLCFFPQNVAQTMETPLFLVNSAYDTWQIKNILAPGAADPRGAWRYCKLNILNCSASQLETMHGFRLEFLKALDALGPSSSRGYFINSCYVHCQTGTQRTWLAPDSPRLANKTIGEALDDWFYDRSLFRHIDCPYPCDTTCQNRVFESNIQSFIVPYGHIDY